MTRAEVKKQIEDGWLSTNVAGIFLGIDLDRSKMDALIGEGHLKFRMDGPVLRIMLDDVCAYVGLTAKELLDRFFPITRTKLPTKKQQAKALGTCDERDAFRRKWDRLYHTMSRWIAGPKAERPGQGELRLMVQLMELSLRVRGFELIVTAKQLEKAAVLDDETLPAARRNLEGRGVLRTTRNGTDWVYTLLDPRTKQPFIDAEPTEDRTGISSWNASEEFADWPQ